MLDATIPRESKSRSVLEQVLLGHYFLWHFMRRHGPSATPWEV
jgi:hypothetical protein